MSYFRVFPKTSYRVDDAGTQKVVTDILNRFTFTDEIKNNGDIFLKYRLKDGETYHDIARRLYGSPIHAWILYLMNDVTDPYEDIPKAQEHLSQYVDEKYPGHALFLNLGRESTNLRAFEGDFVVGETVYAASNNIEDGQEVLTELGYTATVLSWDGNLRKLVVTDEAGINNLTSLVRIVGSTSNARGSFKRRLKNTLAVHHFEDEFGNVLSPLPSPLSPDESSPLDGYLDQSEQVGVNTISNFRYEEKENENKAIIKVLRVEYAKQIIQDVQKVFDR